jgi:hypothetical protein
MNNELLLQFHPMAIYSVKAIPLATVGDESDVYAM